MHTICHICLAGIVLPIFLVIAPFHCPAQGITEDRVALSAPAGTASPPSPVKAGESPIPAVIRIKTMKKVDFSGTVSRINWETRTITLRHKGKEISFDVTNPILVGYTSLKEIKPGELVSVGYTRAGTEIKRGALPVTQRDSTVPLPQANKTGGRKPGKGRIVWLARKTNGTSFTEIDNNKDGKISPVELSVIIPDLTPDKFKEYDRNGDGFLDESEYNRIIRKK